MVPGAKEGWEKELTLAKPENEVRSGWDCVEDKVRVWGLRLI